MKVSLRRAVREDREFFLVVFDDARRFLRDSGVDQWQDGYPELANIERDIERGEARIIECGGTEAGVVTVVFGREPTYAKICGGSWLADGEYVTIHRAAVLGKYRRSGTMSAAFGEVEKEAKKLGAGSVRIDTHRDNIAMRGAIEKSGFSFCGYIYLENGAERVAYEKKV